MSTVTQKKYINFIFYLIVFNLLVFLVYAFFEGQLLSARETEAADLNVGVAEVISFSVPDEAYLTPEIIGPGDAYAKTTWNINTNAPEGWKVELQTAHKPALIKDKDSFADYQEKTQGVPETWKIDALDSAFGFTSAGEFANSHFLNGSRYLGFDGSQSIEVAHNNKNTFDGGDQIEVEFKAEVGRKHTQPAGQYKTIITATAYGL